MNIKKDLLKILKTTVMLTPLLGCIGTMVEERGRDFYAERINRDSSIEAMLITITILADEKSTTYEKNGSGFVIGHYIISRDHVTSQYSVLEWRLTPYGSKQTEIPLNRELVSDEQTFLDEKILYPVIERKEDDLAIFDLSKTPELCEKYCNDLTLDDLMTEDKLYQGMEVYWVGSPEGNRGFYKESHISKLRDENDEDSPVEDTFMIQYQVIKGTSGRPIWSGNKIAGVFHYVWNGMTGIGFMDPYITEIKKYENDM